MHEVKVLTGKFTNFKSGNEARLIMNFPLRCRSSYPTKMMTESEEKKPKKTDSLVSGESEFSSGNNQGTRHQLKFR